MQSIAYYGLNLSCNIYNKFFITLYFIYLLLTIVLYTYNQQLLVILNLFFISISMYFFSNLHGFNKGLIYLTILYIPQSFIGIIDTESSVSWFHFLVILQTLIALKKANKMYVTSITAFAIVSMLMSINNSFIFDSLKQILMNILFMCSFICIGFYKELFNKYDLNTLVFYYLIGIIGFSLQVVLQFYCFYMFGLKLGTLGAFANRIAFAGLFGDYSFASLYLASGSIACLIQSINYKYKNLFTLFISLYLILISVITSARTGISSWIITMLAYFCFNFKLDIKHIFIMLFITIFSFCGLFVISELRGKQKFTDSSGRLENYIKSFVLIEKNPIFGVGYGLLNFKTQIGMTIPHNFFIQYLVQGGITGLMLISFPFLLFMANNFKNANDYKWLFVHTCSGAMVIPDIISSRFLYAIIVIVSIAYKFSFRQDCKVNL